MYICIYVMILGFSFFIQTFLKLCKALRTEKYKRYINILLLLFIINRTTVKENITIKKKDDHRQSLYEELFVYEGLSG